MSIHQISLPGRKISLVLTALQYNKFLHFGLLYIILTNNLKDIQGKYTIGRDPVNPYLLIAKIGYR
jgi:hypothetical protein